uniref:Uncharacterized protein n=1 Tax=Timema cristinae TaxID=61476 RepID=A0A7R9CMQ8_TIMCR|nr:unnamed protein product [Timema cristinae]
MAEDQSPKIHGGSSVQCGVGLSFYGGPLKHVTVKPRLSCLTGNENPDRLEVIGKMAAHIGTLGNATSADECLPVLCESTVVRIEFILTVSQMVPSSQCHLLPYTDMLMPTSSHQYSAVTVSTTFGGLEKLEQNVKVEMIYVGDSTYRWKLPDGAQQEKLQ